MTLWMLWFISPSAHDLGIDGYMNGVWNASAGIKPSTSPVAPWST